MKEIILYSGGMDSTVLLHARASNIVLALSVVYGSKHNGREAIAADYFCKKLGIQRRVVHIDFNAMGMESDLLQSGGDIPDGHYEDESMRRTVVPFRNGIMLSIAAGIADSMGAGILLLANHAGDHAIYPDCRDAFILPMADAIAHGTYNGVVLDAPFTYMTKRDIALEGKRLGVEFERTYSCYKGQEKHCGKCGTCTERMEALSGFDTTEYTEE